MKILKKRDKIPMDSKRLEESGVRTQQPVK